MQTNNQSKHALRRCNLIAAALIICGIVLAFFCGTLSITGACMIKKPADIGVLVLCIAVTGFGVVLFAKGMRRLHIVKDFYTYSARFADDPTRSLEKLGTSSGESHEAVVKKLTLMLHYGFFPDCYIDTSENCFVFPEDKKSEEDAAAEYINIKCPNCGATSSIKKGTTGECVYCGSKLTAK